MGKESAPSPPKPPDYAAAATAQGVANKDAAVAGASLSNPNIYSPYGNQTVTYANTGPDGNAQPTVTQSLTPDAQATLDEQQRVERALAGLGEQGIGTAQNVLGKPFEYNGPDVQTKLDLSGVPKAPVNAGMTAQQALLSRLQPTIAQNRQALDQKLANQGLTPGSEAYENAHRDQSNNENDLYLNAALQGINVDEAANQQGFNQAQSAGQFNNTAAAQALQQQLGLYNVPLNQITALMSGSQIQNPSFQAYSGQNVQAAPVFAGAQAQGQSAMDLYGLQSNNVNSYNSGLMGLYGSIAGAGARAAAGK